LVLLRVQNNILMFPTCHWTTFKNFKNQIWSGHC